MQLLAQGRHGTVYLVVPKKSDNRLDTGDASGPSTEVTENEAIQQQVGRLRGLIVVKVVQAGPTGRSAWSRPHDVLREVALLRALQHPNIISLLSYTYDPPHREHYLHLPYLPLTLSTLANLPVNDALVKSVAFQIVSTIAYLHEKGIAHRDLNPANLLVDWDGGVKLIDFGIAWDSATALNNNSLAGAPDGGVHERGRTSQGEESSLEMEDDNWRETGEEMVCQVGTGHYRAPELLFGPTTYDPYAIDLWALGVIFAEFLTARGPRRGRSVSSSGSSASDVDSNRPHGDDSCSRGNPEFGSHSNTERAEAGLRQGLFDSTFGDLGLVGSIFKVLGIPTPETWPEFTDLPDAGKFEFGPFHPRPLADSLPDLPGLNAYPDSPQGFEKADESIDISEASMMLSLIESLLALSPSRRLPARQALIHPYLQGDVLVPVGYAARYRYDAEDTSRRLVETKDGVGLVDQLRDEYIEAEERVADIIRDDHRV